MGFGNVHFVRRGKFSSSQKPKLETMFTMSMSRNNSNTVVNTSPQLICKPGTWTESTNLVVICQYYCRWPNYVGFPYWFSRLCNVFDILKCGNHPFHVYCEVDWVIYRCIQSCGVLRERGHYHCPICDKAVISRGDFSFHLKGHDAKQGVKQARGRKKTLATVMGNGAGLQNIQVRTCRWSISLIAASNSLCTASETCYY